MLPEYADIRALTDAEPYWYTDGGVPLYAPFHHSMLGVYDQVAVLAAIECAGCRVRLLVGAGRPRYDFGLFVRDVASDPSTVPPRPMTIEGFMAIFCVGDPPRHDCPGAGETMGAT